MPLRPELAGILDALVKNRCAEDLNKHTHTHKKNPLTIV